VTALIVYGGGEWRQRARLVRGPELCASLSCFCGGRGVVVVVVVVGVGGGGGGGGGDGVGVGSGPVDDLAAASLRCGHKRAPLIWRTAAMEWIWILGMDNNRFFPLYSSFGYSVVPNSILGKGRTEEN